SRQAVRHGRVARPGASPAAPKRRLDSPVVEIRDLLIDDSTKQAFRSGVALDLTPTEFELLSVLARSPNEVYSKGQLLSQVWGFDAYDPNLVEVHVSALRRKLETHG